MSDLMNELLNNTLNTDLKDNFINFSDDTKNEFIKSIFDSLNLEEEKLLETEKYSLFKKTKHKSNLINVKIIIFKELNISYILETDKIVRIKKENLNSDEVLKYLIETIYRQYDIWFDIISKALFSEFLERFMKRVDEVKLKIKYNNSHSAIKCHQEKWHFIHNPI